MDAHKLQLKLFAETKGSVSQSQDPERVPDPPRWGSGGGPASAPTRLEVFIPVFHRWIKDGVITGDTLVDVANYAHVPQGPGVVLIGHGADYFMDEGEGRLGLLYNRKRAEPPPGERLADAFRNTVKAALLLEADPALAGLKLRTDEWLFRINDRLAAPSTDETFAAVRPELEAFCKKLFPDAAIELTRVGTPRTLFSVRISVRPSGWADPGLGGLNRHGAEAGGLNRQDAMAPSPEG
jgi:hypothetical protein